MSTLPPPQSGQPIGCLCGCGKPGLTRGLCPAAYKAAKAKVKAGETTWQQLEAQGKALPGKPNAWRAAEASKPKKQPKAADPLVVIARIIRAEGKATTARLSEATDLPWDEIHRITRHPWFDRQSDGLHLTRAGWDATGGKTDEED